MSPDGSGNKQPAGPLLLLCSGGAYLRLMAQLDLSAELRP